MPYESAGACGNGSKSKSKVNVKPRVLAGLAGRQWRTPWTEVLRTEMPRFREPGAVILAPPVPHEAAPLHADPLKVYVFCFLRAFDPWGASCVHERSSVTNAATRL